ncbi:hypothetical protein WME75_24045 [Sorangium sp. So ce1014]|uniref:hypothetical protein n=1 Tax=Sorangium sp. So ce1014 TaxID=3133326 RepID=UPI003F625261
MQLPRRADIAPPSCWCSCPAALAALPGPLVPFPGSAGLRPGSAGAAPRRRNRAFRRAGGRWGAPSAAGGEHHARITLQATPDVLRELQQICAQLLG